MNRVLRHVVLVAVLSLSGTVRAADAQWMNLIPRTNSNGYAATFLDACLNTGQWPIGKARTKYLGSWKGDLDNTDDGSLQGCFSNLLANGLSLSIEGGVYHPYSNPPILASDYFWTYVYPTLQRLRSLGAPPILYRMDEPYAHGVHDNGWSREDVTNQVLVFLQLMRAYFPDIEISLIEPWPLFSVADISWFIGAITNGANSMGIARPNLFDIDHDKNAGGWSWYDVGTICSAAHSSAWGCSYILGSPRIFGDTWHQTALAQGAGLSGVTVPDIYTFESWETSPPDPVNTVPEDFYSPPTFTATVNGFIGSGYFPW